MSAARRRAPRPRSRSPARLPQLLRQSHLLLRLRLLRLLLLLRLRHR